MTILRHLLVITAIGSLGLGSLPLQADGDPARETPTNARTVSLQLGKVDAVTGDLNLTFPVGPKLPGRIPLGFTFTFDSQDTALSQAGGSLKPVVWPGGSGSPQITTVLVSGVPWVFQKKAAPANGAMPTSDQVHQWMTLRHVDDGQADAASVNDPTAGITPTFRVIEINPSIDGTSFFVRTAWTIGYMKPIGRTGDTVAATKDAAGRSIILDGPNAIWTGTYGTTPNAATLVTHFTNTWGDHVTETDTGGNTGSPMSIQIRNEMSTTEWVRWDRNDSAQTITVTSSPSLPLPSVTIHGTFHDIERQQTYWSVYPIPYTPGATFQGTGIFDGGIVPDTLTVTAGSESRVTNFTWISRPAYTQVNPFVNQIQVTIPATFDVSSITHPSGLREEFGYSRVGRLSTDSFNPPFDGNSGGQNQDFTGYSAWSSYETPWARTDHFYDPVNPAGAAWGVSSITVHIPANPVATPLVKQVPMAPTGGGEGGTGGGGGSTAPDPGYTVIIARKFPSAQSYPTASERTYNSAFTWVQKDHTTTILRYPTTSPQATTPFRGVRITHPSATGGCAFWGSGSGSDPISVKQAAYLFATSGVLKEELIHGSQVSFAASHPDDWEPVSPVVDETTVFDEWDLSCWSNPTGDLAKGLPVNPRSSRTTKYLGSLPGTSIIDGSLDAFGPTRSDQYYSLPASAPTILGTSTPQWSGGNVLAQIYGSSLQTTPLERSGMVSRHWDANLMLLLTDSTQKTLSGSPLSGLRSGVASVDFGTSQYTYDAQGRVSTITGSRGGSIVATETRSYVAGLPLVSDTIKTLTSSGQALPLSGVVGKSYTYDSSPYQWLKSETDKLDGRATTILQRDPVVVGRILQFQDPEGVVITLTYDSWGRVKTKKREAKGAEGPLTTTFGYAANGSWAEESTSYTDDAGQAITLTTHTDFDAAGRGVKITRPDGSYQITQYDGYGAKFLQTPWLKPGQTPYGNFQWSYDDKGRLLATYDPKGRRTSYQPNDPTWDGGDSVSGRVVSTIYGPGSSAVNAGDSELARVTKVDLLGQAREVIDQAGQLSSYTYDKDGHLASTNQNGQVRSYTYNDLGWLISRTEPEEGTTVFDTFTMMGLPLRTTQTGRSGSGGLRTQVTLNGWGLPSEIQVWNGATLSTDRLLTYDNTTHWLTSLWESQPNGTLLESYGYDDLGRLASKTISDEGGQSFTVSRTLDAAGNVSSESYPSGGGRPTQTVRRAYDLNARAKGVTLDFVNRGTETYDQVNGTAVSQVLNLGNGASTTITVDSGQLVDVKHLATNFTQDSQLKWSTGGLLLFRGPDANATAPTQSDTFQYDALQRLSYAKTLSWDNPDSTKWDTLAQTFSYDRWGNRASEGFTWTSPTGRTKPDEVLAWSATYNGASELPNGIPQNVTAPNGSSLATGRSYDDFGRLTAIFAIPGQTATQFSWTYDASGRVTAENTSSFLLDAEGLRFRRTVPGQSVQYTVYGFGREPLAVFEQASSSTSSSSSMVASIAIDPGGGGGGGGTAGPAGAFITQPSGAITVATGVAIPFTGTTTYGTAGAWTFGDGGTSSGFTASHTFLAAGTFTVVFTASATGYTSSTASVTITVVPAPKITAFTASLTTLTLGQSITLNWSTVNAASLSLDNGLGSVTGLTSKAVTPGQTGNITYTLTATNAGATTSAQVTVYVSPSPAPVINSFTATPTAVPSGQSVTLKWNVTQASTVSISGVGNVSGNNKVVKPTATTTYTLTATNGAGSVTASVTITIITTPVINRFTAGPAAVTTGEKTMLSWDVTGATGLSLSAPGMTTLSVTGATYAFVSPTATTTYTLTATNSAGGVSKQALVTVSAPASLTWKRSMVYGYGQLLSEERADVGTVYLQGDQVGSPSILTDAGGNVVGRTKGLPFGERGWSSGTQSSRRYTNHEDQPGSPIYMQARMYLPAYGKFAQPDPAYDQAKGDPESWNLFGYVTNNPVTHTDPDGRIQALWDPTDESHNHNVPSDDEFFGPSVSIDADGHMDLGLGSWASWLDPEISLNGNLAEGLYGFDHPQSHTDFYDPQGNQIDKSQIPDGATVHWTIEGNPNFSYYSTWSSSDGAQLSNVLARTISGNSHPGGKYLSDDAFNALLKALRALPQFKDYFDIADKDGYKFVQGPIPGKNVLGVTDSDAKTVTVDTAKLPLNKYGNVDLLEVVRTIGHELRHVWQIDYLNHHWSIRLAEYLNNKELKAGKMDWAWHSKIGVRLDEDPLHMDAEIFGQWMGREWQKGLR